MIGKLLCKLGRHDWRDARDPAREPPEFELHDNPWSALELPVVCARCDADDVLVYGELRR